LIDCPVFIYGSKEDHIVPWPAAYASTQLLNKGHPGRNRFVLGASGHIAGVINSPVKKKRSHWIGKGDFPEGGFPHEPEKWLAQAKEVAGSWWPEWAQFLRENGGKQVAAPKALGSTKYPPIEAAPGRYVKVRAD
jgi:polyhydroxyalkanoate synthase